MTKVFIDGAAGTTGLKIAARLGERGDVELVNLPDGLRKDATARKNALTSADVAFLCLPDAAAIEAAALAEDANTVIIDASTAHRVNPAWTYGFAELAGMRERIAASRRIANPGCHASGFIALVAPLVQAGLLPADARLAATSLTGYSGGGKKMIAEYEGAAAGTSQPAATAGTSEAASAGELLAAPAAAGASQPAATSGVLDGGNLYGLGQAHKHLPEMMAVCGLRVAPVFLPIVEPMFSGMQVIVPLQVADYADCGLSKSAVEGALEAYYNTASGGLVRFVPEQDAAATFGVSGRLSAAALAGCDDMAVTVCGNDERIALIATFDNLGKGASGAAIQNMNIALGLDEATGLKTFFTR